MLRDGYSQKEIAENLGVSIKSVKATLLRVYHKMGVSGQLELVKCLLLPLDSPLR